MDLLQTSAMAFEQLLDIQYHMVIGRKGKKVELKVEFSPEEFHHLIGLHKLRDLRVARGNREQIFKDILLGKISLAEMEKSQYFREIENRLRPFAQLEALFDRNNLIFRYNEKQSFSLIRAEYLLSTPYNATDIYIFLDQKEICENYFCRSFFPKEIRNYTLNQAAYTLLFKEKTDIGTGEKEIQYDRLTPIPL